MDRMTAFLASIALLALFFAYTEVGAYNCPEPMQQLDNGDCGLFPDDPDIMRVPANNSDSVVARWSSPSGRPVRIINRSDHDIPVFLRTSAEFQSFLEKLSETPDLDSCEVVDQPWRNARKCATLSRDGKRVVPISCEYYSHRTACDLVHLPMLFTCSGTSCGGTCTHTGNLGSIIQGNVAALWVRPISPPFAACEPGCTHEWIYVKEGCGFRPWLTGQSAKQWEIRTVKSHNSHLGSGTFMCTHSGGKWKWTTLRYTCSCPGEVLANGRCKPQ